MKETWNAFVKDDLNINPTGSGRLNGLTFAVKDVFEIKNVQNTAGNPDWFRTHAPAKSTAEVIEKLLKEGAFLKGTTQTDELMFSLNGENVHYGTPKNPRSTDRIPGGSSSGSAVAVAAGLVDFALGTDTGGSVRVPSSYCGIYGFRPTHGAVKMDGVIPLANSFDTVGLMTRDVDLLLELGKVLFVNQKDDSALFDSVFMEEESWFYLDNESKEILLAAVSVLAEMTVHQQWVKLAHSGLKEWFHLFRQIQGIEIWAEHGRWIEEVNPAFGPGIAERFSWTRTLDYDDLNSLQNQRKKMNQDLSDLLKKNGLLVIPTVPGEAPLLNLPGDELDDYREKTMKLTCIAGLTGFPQVTIPLFKKNGLPVGLSLIANQNQDLKLMTFANKFAKKLQGNGFY